VSEEDEQRQEVQGDPLDARERVVLHGDGEVEGRERVGEAGDEGGGRASGQPARQQVHRAAGEHEAQEDLEVVRAEALIEAAERQRDHAVDGLDRVLRNLESERGLELGKEGRRPRAEVGVMDPAEVRDPAPVVVAEPIEPAQRMARERPRRHYGHARVEGEDGEGLEDSGAQDR
jgi:hypothetical protein